MRRVKIWDLDLHEIEKRRDSTAFRRAKFLQFAGHDALCELFDGTVVVVRAWQLQFEDSDASKVGDMEIRDELKNSTVPVA